MCRPIQRGGCGGQQGLLRVNIYYECNFQIGPCLALRKKANERTTLLFLLPTLTQVPAVGSIRLDGVSLSPTCVDAEMYSTPVTQFEKERTDSFFSNIFVQTLSSFPEGYSIVEVW